MDKPEASEIANLLDLNAKAISCLATGAMPNEAMIAGVQDHLNSMLWLLDELISLVETGAIKAPLTKVH